MEQLQASKLAGVEFDAKASQGTMYKNYCDYLKRNYGAALIMNMMNLNAPGDDQCILAFEGCIQKNFTENIRYKYFNLND